MAHSGNGTTSKIVAGAAIAAASLTTPAFHFMYRNGATPGTAVTHVPFAITDSGNTYQINFAWDNTTAAGSKAVNTKEAGGTVRRAQMTSSPSADTWYAIGGYYDGTNTGISFEGIVETTTACAALTLAADPTPSALSAAAGTANFDDGIIAEIGVWNAVLRADEWLALGRHISPLAIRPQSLILYWPLIRDVYAIKGATQPTATATTVAVHPYMTYPHTKSYQGWYSDVTSTAAVSGSVEDSLSLTDSGADETSAIDTMSVDDEFVSDGNRGVVEDTIAIKEGFVSNSGYLVTGRVRNRIRR
jgi:hypothetical protein